LSVCFPKEVFDLAQNRPQPLPFKGEQDGFNRHGQHRFYNSNFSFSLSIVTNQGK